VKGISTFVINLFKAGLNVHNPMPGQWMEKYCHGQQHEIYPVILPPCFHEQGLTYVEVKKLPLFVKKPTIDLKPSSSLHITYKNQSCYDPFETFFFFFTDKIHLKASSSSSTSSSSHIEHRNHTSCYSFGTLFLKYRNQPCYDPFETFFFFFFFTHKIQKSAML
jgi:hypothetical protein